MKPRLVPTRNIFDSIFILGGVLIIVVQVLAIADSRLQMAMVAVGIVMIYLGVWRLGSRLLPERRVHRQLRSEVNHFLTLVRQINAHAIAAEVEQASEIKSALHKSVEQIALVAGLEDREPTTT